MRQRSAASADHHGGRDARQRGRRLDGHVVVQTRGAGQRTREQPARRAVLALVGVDRPEQAAGHERGRRRRASRQFLCAAPLAALAQREQRRLTQAPSVEASGFVRQSSSAI